MITLASETNGKPHRLVRIRDTQNVDTYRGKWDDKSKLWEEPEAKELLLKSKSTLNQKDGCFWIPVETLSKAIDKLWISSYQEDYFHSYLKIPTLFSKAYWININVKVKGEYQIYFEFDDLFDTSKYLVIHIELH